MGAVRDAEHNAVRFRVLGPVEVWIGGVRLWMAESRELKILVGLLLSSGRVVSLARLVDMVWDDRPPRTAAKAARNAVAELRRRLSAAGGPGELITTEPAGYLLRVDETQVDLLTFTRMAAEGRQLAAAGQLDSAALRLREALTLWRGPALSGVTGRMFEVAGARLDEQRMTVQEDCLSHELALGRGPELLDELTALVDAYPLRERARGQLIRALYRSGRRGDALETYRQGRELMVGELGLEPGSDLTALHQAILAGDPTLEPAAPADSPPAGRTAPSHPIPAQLPPSSAMFSGRTAQLGELDTLLDAGLLDTTLVISAVSGTAGVGKTTLAVHWAHKVADRFADGQLYANLRGFDPGGTAVPPAQAIRGFLDALGVTPERVPASLDAQTGLYRSLITGRRMLVVLDNARDAEQVRPLLPGGRGCLVIVTSRNQMPSLVAAHGAHCLNLDLPTHGEAHEMLTRRLGRSRVAAAPQAVDEIITRCARLPLALAIVAARAAAHPGFPLAELAAGLGDSQRRLDALAAGDAATDLRAVFSWSYQTLSPGAARLFRLLGLHPGPDISTAATASLTGLPVARVRPLLAELAHAHLTEEQIPGRYTFHDLLRAYATELSGGPDTGGEARAATLRLLDHYLHTAYAAALLVHPHQIMKITLDPPEPGTVAEHPTDIAQALAWFDVEHRALLGTVTLAADAGFDTHTWQLAWTIAIFLQRQGHWREWANTLHTALDAARRLADPDGQAYAHRTLGTLYVRLGMFDTARSHMTQSLALAGELGDLSRQAHTYLGLAWVDEQQGRYREALGHIQKARELYDAAGARAGQANALNAVGWCHALLGEFSEALKYCEQALAIHQEIQDRSGEADTWDSLGYVHHHLRHHTRAIASYQKAIMLYQALGGRYDEAGTLTKLGDTQHAAGDLAAARAAWHEALAILNDLNHPDADNVRTKIMSS